MPTHAFTTCKLAVAACVGVEAVRYYRRCGVLAAPNRVDGGFRRYSKDDIRHFRFIKRAQALRYSMHDIAQLMPLSNAFDPLRVGDITCERVAEIRDRMADLQSMVSALEKLADSCAQAPGGSVFSIIAAVTGNPNTDPTGADAGLVVSAGVADRCPSVPPCAGTHRRVGEIAVWR